MVGGIRPIAPPCMTAAKLPASAPVRLRVRRFRSDVVSQSALRVRVRI